MNRNIFMLLFYIDKFLFYIIMKIRTSVKKFCRYCKVIRRKRVVRVLCNKDKRHKQKQG
ncbi:50S ribosomal protein L36 [Candidatus Legionella polyplacis]